MPYLVASKTFASYSSSLTGSFGTGEIFHKLVFGSILSYPWILAISSIISAFWLTSFVALKVGTSIVKFLSLRFTPYSKFVNVVTISSIDISFPILLSM